MFVLGACLSFAAASLAILIAVAVRSAPEAFEDEKGLQIVRQPTAEAPRRAKRRQGAAVHLRPHVKTA